jgi:transposase-like protein
MVLVPVTCPYCHSDQVIKGGKTETGKQRYRCQQTNCSHRSFVLEPAYNGRLPQVKEQIVEMARMSTSQVNATPKRLNGNT